MRRTEASDKKIMIDANSFSIHEKIDKVVCGHLKIIQFY